MEPDRHAGLTEPGGGVCRRAEGADGKPGGRMSPQPHALIEDAALWRLQTTEYLEGCLRSLRLQTKAARDRDDLAAVRQLTARMKPIAAELKWRRTADEPTP